MAVSPFFVGSIERRHETIIRRSEKVVLPNRTISCPTEQLSEGSVRQSPSESSPAAWNSWPNTKLRSRWHPLNHIRRMHPENRRYKTARKIFRLVVSQGAQFQSLCQVEAL